MTKSKINSSVRLFGGYGTPEDLRSTMETPGGTIYAETPEARAYLEAKAWVDRLAAISGSFGGMSFDKAQTIAEIVDLLPIIPETGRGIRETLLDLGEALQGRVSNHSGANFRDAGSAFAALVVTLRNYVNTSAFGLDIMLNAAPRPPHPDAARLAKASQGRPAGSWARENGGF